MISFMIGGDNPILTIFLLTNIASSYNVCKLLCHFWIICQMKKFCSEKLSLMPIHGDIYPVIKFFCMEQPH